MILMCQKLKGCSVIHAQLKKFWSYLANSNLIMDMEQNILCVKHQNKGSDFKHAMIGKNPPALAQSILPVQSYEQSQPEYLCTISKIFNAHWLPLTCNSMFCKIVKNNTILQIPLLWIESE